MLNKSKKVSIGGLLDVTLSVTDGVAESNGHKSAAVES